MMNIYELIGLLSGIITIIQILFYIISRVYKIVIHKIAKDLAKEIISYLRTNR